jgi:hypothetical protein
VTIPNTTFTPCQGGASEVNGGSGSGACTFTGNGSYTFTFTDPAGNSGQATAIVDRIDTTPPHTTLLSYSPSTTTNGNVLATLVADEPITLLGSGRTPSGVIASGTQGDVALQRTKEFTDNTGITLDFVDAVGNPASTQLSITRIDRTPAIPTIIYSPATATNTNVIATISFNKTGVHLTNNGGASYYVFTGNGTFTFVFTDPAGNVGTALATVDRIDKTAPIATSLTYAPSTLTS